MLKLLIHFGIRLNMANKRTIPIFWPYQGAVKEIIKEIEGTLNSRWWGQGPKVEQFEKEFGKKFGYKYPLFVNSGTAALDLAYHIIGIKEGDEVIVPVLDCTAGQGGIVRRGAKIVFADIEKMTFNIDPDDVRMKITPKTKVIVAVHLGGVPVDDDIFRIGRQYKIPVITDSSQMHAPTKGDYICYSLQAIKHMSTGDGGMLVLRNKSDYDRAKLLRWFGIDRDQKKKSGWQAWSRRQMTFDINEAGYKYQPTDIDACFGLVNLKHLDKEIDYRRRLAAEYLRGLENVDDIDVIVGGTYWLFGILTEDRDNLADFLLKDGIEANLVHLRNDIFDVFKKYKTYCSGMDWVESRYLYLPMNSKVTIKDVQFITKKIKEFYGA